jgi:DNA-binding response OmpR family regulator
LALATHKESLSAKCGEPVKPVCSFREPGTNDDRSRGVALGTEEWVKRGRGGEMETTLLLVDDEPKVLEILAPYLRQEGYRIVTATTGRGALALVQSERPTLVVLDWMLPEMSGIEVCREFRRQGPIGIIMLTAKTDELDMIIGLEVGADDYLTKPFSLRALSARIHSVLRRIEGQTAAEQAIRRGRLIIARGLRHKRKAGIRGCRPR